ncbi:MAG: hypothetical protein JWN14_1663 [Chthonomonadales bacterium]|nr:hypothetical protein [Chthonomonadales bacterium]
MRKQTHFFVGTLLTTCTLLTAIWGYSAPRQQTTPSARAFGNYTSQQMLVRSQETMGSLMGGTARGNVEIARTTVYTASGRAHPTWIVDFEDPTSGINASMLWDADTGELLRVFHRQQRDLSFPYDAPSSRNTAMALAWDWFHVLKGRDRTRKCQVVAARKLHYARWEVTIQTGVHTSFLVVNPITGRMITMACIHRGDPHLAAHGTFATVRLANPDRCD